LQGKHGYPAAFPRFMDSADIFDTTAVSVSLILTVSSLPHTGQGIKAMLCGSSLACGFAPQSETQPRVPLLRLL
jgi:hypothetical protein